MRPSTGHRSERSLSAPRRLSARSTPDPTHDTRRLATPARSHPHLTSCTDPLLARRPSPLYRNSRSLLPHAPLLPDHHVSTPRRPPMPRLSMLPAGLPTIPPLALPSCAADLFAPSPGCRFPLTASPLPRPLVPPLVVVVVVPSSRSSYQALDDRRRWPRRTTTARAVIDPYPSPFAASSTSLNLLHARLNSPPPALVLRRTRAVLSASARDGLSSTATSLCPHQRIHPSRTTLPRPVRPPSLALARP